MIYSIVPYLAKAAGMRPITCEIALESAEDEALKEFPERNIQTFTRTLEIFRKKHPFDLTELQRAREQGAPEGKGHAKSRASN